MTNRNRRISRAALAGGLILCTGALAFPPAPHHTLHGVIKNQYGTPLATGAGTVILSGPAGEVVRGTVDSSIATGINYRLEVPEDGNRSSLLYTAKAMISNSPYTIRVVVNNVSFVPMQLAGQTRTLGDPAGTTRLDLTLGVDSDGDGLPDAWEQDMIDFDPEDGLNTLADVKPGDDSDGDGMTNLAEYIAGSYAFDNLDALSLEVKEVANELARLEFTTVSRRTYRLTSSTDGATWTPQPFSLKATGADLQATHLAESVTPLQVWAPVGTNPKCFSGSMLSKLTVFRGRRGWIAGALLLTMVTAALLVWPRRVTPDRGERFREELDLRNGVLLVRGSNEPFTGRLIEEYGRNSRKLEISIRNGRADGLSRGWFENGRQEVEETFVAGVSNGMRTRWHENGVKKSEGMIEDGKFTGRYTEWHDNGQKASEVTMINGKPHGQAEAWHPSGKLKSRVQLDHGVPGEKEFFPDDKPVAHAGEPTTSP